MLPRSEHETEPESSSSSSVVIPEKEKKKKKNASLRVLYYSCGLLPVLGPLTGGPQGELPSRPIPRGAHVEATAGKRGVNGSGSEVPAIKSPRASGVLAFCF